uniref:uncharacterized protein LOC101296302 n=1 Tax=Fragaria vesca subsp. vesca TaxID=101020 RepID=UPI0005CB34ED|nr:PREDICTED: uncharacterized protein LOC101296302 [Fragaria vesca subsp. vesca]
MAARHYNNLFALSLFTVCLFASAANADYDHGHNHKVTQNWLNHGGDLRNRRYAKYETKISPETVSKLRFKWEFKAGQDITVTPSIYDGTLYFPSWNGHLYALKASDGSVVWEKNMGILTGLNWTGFITPNWIVSRSTPTIAGDNDELLIVGIYGPAVLIALERSTGKLVWSVRLDSHAAGAITMSPTYYKGSIYIGTTSVEEGVSPDECCTFRGSFSKLDVKTGAVLWQTYMLPDNHGKLGQYSGAAIWGSSPSIDVHRRHVYIATGNTYSVPEYISQCQENQLNTTNSSVPTHSDACVEPVNHGNSILALDMDTGEIQWYRQLGGYDVWFLECFLNTSVCPIGPNVDADFGEAPMMLRPYINETKRDIVVAVQKSGFAWALDRNNGSLVWSTEVGPGGILGGGSWGAATDKKRVYTNIINNGGKNFTLKPSNNVTTSGGWAAMDPRSGEVLWSTANPSNAFSAGPVSVANGVLFGGSTDANGTVYAMNTRTGEILWSYETGATVYGGMSISNGCIYVGSGYKVGFGATMPMFTAGTSLFAFCVT